MRIRWVGRVIAVGLSLLLSVAKGTDAQQVGAGGSVAISYTMARLVKIASNQLAVWIEDETGRYVRTLFATDFMARKGGWKRREQVCPVWVKSADVKSAPQEDIDAVSGPTPRNGVQTVVWDLKDRAGRLVPPGIYRYRIEGNLFWENTVLWTGLLRVRGGRDVSQATATYSPEGAEKQGTMITAVGAVYEPGN